MKEKAEELLRTTKKYVNLKMRNVIPAPFSHVMKCRALP